MAGRKANEITFGVEIECFIPNIVGVTDFAIGAYHNGIQIPGLPAGWNSQRDGSIYTRRDGFRSIEVVSPVLKGTEGIASLIHVAETLKTWGAKTNPTCGFHVHVGMNLSDEDSIIRLIHQVSNHEKALFAASGTPRRERGSYCRSIKKNWEPIKDKKPQTLRSVGRNSERYFALNLQTLLGGGRPTAEFRAFSGTIEPRKMAGYVFMALAFTEKAENAACAPYEPNNVRTFENLASDNAGEREMKRFFIDFGWDGTYCRTTYGLMPTGEEITLEGTKRILLRLARTYDRKLKPEREEMRVRLQTTIQQMNEQQDNRVNQRTNAYAETLMRRAVELSNRLAGREAYRGIKNDQDKWVIVQIAQIQRGSLGPGEIDRLARNEMEPF